MSTSSSSLSAGLQVLVNDGLLPSNLTSQQLKNASAGQLTQIEVDTVEANSVSSLFGGGAASSDSVSLNGNLSSSLLSGSNGSNGSTTDPLLQALETAVTNSSHSAATSGTTSSTTGSNLTNPGSDTIGTLFSYLG